MAVRVALLILVTGMFAALWSGDHPVQASTTPASKLSYPTNPRSWETHPLREARQGGDRIAHTPAPLPTGIIPGTYLVSDQRGKTEVRVISGNVTNKQMPGSASNHDYFTVKNKNGRWHYIRIENAAIQQNQSDEL